jgi:hypothetical protein
MRVIALAGCAAVCFLSWFPSASTAQSLIVRVTAEESGTPLSGVFVSLLDREGQILRSALTDEAGRFVFPVGAPGLFQVKAELIGRETRVSSPVELPEGGSVTVRLTLTAHAISLGEIRVEAAGRCQLRPEEASGIARVWEEARKPLAIQVWAERAANYRLDISTYERDLDAEGRRVERENRRGTSRVTRVPFASLPPEDAVRGGFVRAVDGGGHAYYGPDAGLLLSDVFLDTHCFRLTRSGDHPGAIGLAFEPVSRGEVADIRGTLWLDEETAALRFVDYTYTWAPYREADGIAGGLVEFESLPDGSWMIERWWIRAPILARRQDLARAGDSGIRVIGVRETGGEVVAVSTLGRRTIAAAERGSLRGVVWDSTVSAPLPGAIVYLSGTGYRTETAPDGRFLLDGLPAGVFTASFTHPRLDSLGVVAAGAEADVTPGRTSEVSLAIPSSATIRLASCRAEEREEGGAVVAGVVTDRTSGQPVPGARVRVAWQEVERMEPVVQAKEHWFEVVADHDGRYMACGVPVDESVRIRASFLQTSGDNVEAAFAEESYRVLDLEIELPPGLFAGQGGATVRSREYGAQGVQGVLIERESGSRIRTASITVRRASGDIVASGETSEDGFFRLMTPTPGRYLLSAQALGYGDIDAVTVDVALGNLTVLDVRMVPEALQLEPIVVTAEPRAFHLEMQGFYRRQHDGLGVFITPQLLEERRPHKVTNLFFGLPGTRVVEPSQGAGGRAVYFRGGERPGGSSSFAICWPMVYVDRHLVSTGGLAGAGAEPTAVDDVVFAGDVLAIEIFRTPAEIPPEFNGPNAGCGVIVLWTRRGGGD